MSVAAGAGAVERSGGRHRPDRACDWPSRTRSGRVSTDKTGDRGVLRPSTIRVGSEKTSPGLVCVVPTSPSLAWARNARINLFISTTWMDTDVFSSRIRDGWDFS